MRDSDGSNKRGKVAGLHGLLLLMCQGSCISLESECCCSWWSVWLKNSPAGKVRVHKVDVKQHDSSCVAKDLR